MIRRYGEPAESGAALSPAGRGFMPSCCDGDHMLATHQAEPVPEFQLPGGGIDQGEHPIPALHREVLRGNRLEDRRDPAAGRVPAVHLHAGI